MQVGEGEFGTVHKAKWYGTIVAVKILRRSDAVAVGDFRSATAPPLVLITIAMLHMRLGGSVIFYLLFSACRICAI